MKRIKKEVFFINVNTKHGKLDFRLYVPYLLTDTLADHYVQIGAAVYAENYPPKPQVIEMPTLQESDFQLPTPENTKKVVKKSKKI